MTDPVDPSRDGLAPAQDPEPRYGERAPVRQAPLYGEYAPPGWVSPVPPVETAEERAARDAVGRDPFTRLPPAGYNASPPTGRPVPGAPPSVARRGGGRFFTMFLLVFGAYHVFTGLFTTSTFATSLVTEFKQYGYLSGAFQSLRTLQAVGTWTASLSAVLFVVVAYLTLRRVFRGRSAWWIPVIGGAIANVGLGIAVVIVIMHDPSYVGMTGG